MSTFALRQPRTSFASAVPAVSVHAALILAAVGATRAVSGGIIGNPPPIFIQWPTLSLPRATTAAPVPTIPGAPLFSTSVISTLPPIDLPLDFPGLPKVDLSTVIPRDQTIGIGLPRGDLYPTSQVFTEAEVDDLPSLLASGRLRYPAVLAEVGIEGAVTLTFVIDTEGKVDPSAIEILSATHPGFVAAAKEAVATSRFHPARKQGTAVSVRVRQTVTFRK